MEDQPTQLSLTTRWVAEVSEAEMGLYDDLASDLGHAADDLPAPPTVEDLHGSPQRHGPRGDGHTPESDPHDAWVTRFELRGSESGPLDGLTVGVKDSIAVAGYPCTLGSTLLSEFVPAVDATAVARVLDAGGTVVGKTNMDAFAMGDAGELQDFGTTTNPHDESRLAGGSSSGSAAAVAAGDCAAALGTDQAGSVRNPAAWCGLVGLKPTHGAVPYTAVAGMDRSVDHVGVLTRDVETNARVFAAIAGEDVQNGCRLDPRQPEGYAGFSPSSTLEAEASELTVGVLAEGFDWPFLEPAVERAVRGSIERLSTAGATCTEVSVALHDQTPEIVGVVASVGGAQTLRSEGEATGAEGWYWEAFEAALGEARRQAPADLPASMLSALRSTTDLAESSRRTAYARAKNGVLAARRAYDEALAECDVLALPTSPTRALEPAESTRERVERLGWLPANTGLFNQTGHPAISVPVGTIDGLPVGLQLVAPHFEEDTLYRAARTVERLSAESA